jgi:hypothetical protein
MMIENPIAWIVVGAGGELALYLILKERTLVRERTLDDVFPFLRALDKDEMAQLFDPMGEAYRRYRSTDYRFRREQHVRLDLAREFFRRMQHNAVIIHQWANTELRDNINKEPGYYNEREQQVITVCERAVEFRMLSRIVLVKIRFLNLLHQLDKLHLAPALRVAALRKTGTADMLNLYERLKDAAAALALTYGVDYYNEINSRM